MTSPDWKRPKHTGKAFPACPSREFIKMMDHYSFLAHDALCRGVAKTDRDREGLDRIVTICSSCRVGIHRSKFRGLTLEQEHEVWRNWLKSARVSQSAIDILEAEERQFEDGVKEFTRRRNAEGLTAPQMVAKICKEVADDMSMPEEKPGQDWTDLRDQASVTSARARYDMFHDEYVARLAKPEDYNDQAAIKFIETGLKAKKDMP